MVVVTEEINIYEPLYSRTTHSLPLSQCHYNRLMVEIIKIIGILAYIEMVHWTSMRMEEQVYVLRTYARTTHHLLVVQTCYM